MITRLEVTYKTADMIEPKTVEITTEERRHYIEEYVPVVHKILSEKLGLDTKEVKIIDWRYIGR